MIRERSESTANLFEAMAKAKAKFPEIPRSGSNPHFGSRFSTLKDIKGATDGILRENGLEIIQFPGQTLTGEPALTTWLIHTPSKEYISETAAISLSKKDPQALGSAFTYLRRYSRNAILDLMDEECDDDGNVATLSDSKAAPNQVASLKAEMNSYAKKVFDAPKDLSAFWGEKVKAGEFSSPFADPSATDLQSAIKLIKALKSGA